MLTKQEFHESFKREEVLSLPSERHFARVIAGCCVAFALLSLWLHGWTMKAGVLFLIAIALLAMGYFAPLILRPLNKAWAKLGHLLHTVVNPVVMFVMYCVAIVPLGLALKLLGKDPLARKFDARAETYWVTKPEASPETMRWQF